MAEQTVTLQPGESKQVSFEAIPHEARTFQVSVDGLAGTFVAQKGIYLKDLNINPLHVNPGTIVTISCTAVNDSSIAGSYTAIFRVEEVDLTLTRDVILQPSESKVLSFEITPFSTGIYHVSIDGLTGVVECTAAPIANIVVRALNFPSQVNVGNAISIEATVKNEGTGPGNKVIGCSVSPGNYHQEKTVELAPNETRLLAFDFTPSAAGAYSVVVENLSRTFEAISTVPTIRLGRFRIHSIGGIGFSETGLIPKYTEHAAPQMAADIGYGIFDQHRNIDGPTGETIDFTCDGENMLVSEYGTKVMVWMSYSSSPSYYPQSTLLVAGGAEIDVPNDGVHWLTPFRRSLFLPVGPGPFFPNNTVFPAGPLNVLGGFGPVKSDADRPWTFLAWTVYLTRSWRFLNGQFFPV